MMSDLTDTSPSVDEDTFDGVLRGYLDQLDDDRPLPADAPLRDLGLNSMRAVDLMFDLEDELGVQLPDEAMTDETFATRDSLLYVVLAAATGR